VTCMAPGVIELRSDDFVANEAKQAVLEQSEWPF
jgi:hypothetical protein